jgi:hypothetical protein
MPEFIIYGKIAGLAGIPARISNEINRFIDDMDPPPEFEEHNTERKKFVCNVKKKKLFNSIPLLPCLNVRLCEYEK